MRNRIGLIVLITLIFFASELGVRAEDSNTFGGDPTRQRVNSDAILPPAEPVWINHNVSQSITQPLIIGDRIYHASARWLWEIPLKDGSNGKEKKLFEIDTGEVSTTGSHPTYFNSVVYIGSKNGNVYGFNIESKKLVGTKKVTGDYGVVSSPLVVNDQNGKVSVIVGSSDGQALYVLKDFLNTASKSKVVCTPGGNVTSSPTLLNSNVFVFATNYNGQKKSGKIAFFDLSKEAMSWKFPTNNGIPSSVAVSGNLAYAIDKTGQLYCLDYSTRKLKWSSAYYSSTSTFANFSPAVADGKVFFPIRKTNKDGAKGNGILTAWDQQTGAKKWATKGIDGEITTSPVVWSAAKLVLVGTSKGKIYGFDINTGKPKSWFTTDGGKTLGAIGKMPGAGSGGIAGDIRPDGITTEFAIANGYLLVGGVEPSGKGMLCAFRLTGSDVALTALIPDNRNPAPGEKVSFKIAVKNLGELPRDISVKVTDNCTGFTQTIPLTAVPGGQTVTAQVYNWTMPVGKATVNARIMSPAGGSKFNYSAANDSQSVNLQAGVDLALSGFTVPTPIFTGDITGGSVTVKNFSAQKITTKIVFSVNNNTNTITPKTVILQPNSSKKVSFTLKAPSTAGNILVKATVNPNKDQPKELNYGNNSVDKRVEVKNPTVSTSGGRLTISAATSPGTIKAGYGFTLTANTKTQPYVHKEIRTTVIDGISKTTVSTHTHACPGAKKVTATFPNGEIVVLIASQPAGTPENTWQLPTDKPGQAGKHYIPPSNPDGEYQVKLVAWGAGNNGNLTAQTKVVITVKGSMYDDIQTRINE